MEDEAHYRMLYIMAGILADFKQKAIWDVVVRFMDGHISKETLRSEICDLFPLWSSTPEQMAETLKLSCTLGADPNGFNEQLDEFYINKPMLMEELKKFVDEPTQDCSR